MKKNSFFSAQPKSPVALEQEPKQKAREEFEFTVFGGSSAYASASAGGTVVKEHGLSSPTAPLSPGDESESLHMQPLARGHGKSRNQHHPGANCALVVGG